MNLLQHFRVHGFKTWFLSLSPGPVFLAAVAAVALFYSTNALSSNFSNPLVDAADIGNEELVETILKQGTLPDSRGDFETTALMRAAFRGNNALVKLLIESGAYINAADVGGETALHLAAKNGHAETVALLLDYGAYIDIPDKEKWTSLMRAANAKQTEVVKLLVSKGADVSLVNDLNESVLTHAAMSGISEIAYMITTSPKANKIKKEQQNLALVEAKRRSLPEIEKIIDHLIDGSVFTTGASTVADNSKNISGDNKAPNTEKKYSLTDTKSTDAKNVGDENKTVSVLSKSKLAKNKKAGEDVSGINSIDHEVSKAASDQLAANKIPLQKSGGATGSVFFVQLGNFKDDKTAETKWGEAYKKAPDVLAKLEPTIVEAHLSADPNDIVYRLRAGELQTKAEADSNCKNLRAKNMECLVVEIMKLDSPKTAIASAHSSVAASDISNVSRSGVDSNSQDTKTASAVESNIKTATNFVGNYPKLKDSVAKDSVAKDSVAKENTGNQPVDIMPKPNANDAINGSSADIKEIAGNNLPWRPSTLGESVPRDNDQVVYSDDFNDTTNEIYGAGARRKRNDQYDVAVSDVSITEQGKAIGNKNIDQDYEDSNADIAPKKASRKTAGKSPKTKSKKNSAAKNRPADNYDEVASSDDFVVNNKEKVRGKVKESTMLNNSQLHGGRGKREDSEYQDFYAKMGNKASNRNVKEAVLVPDENYFAKSSSYNDSTGNVGDDFGNWLNISGLPSEEFANDYGLRMFKYDESLGNVEIMLVKSVVQDANAGKIGMRVGPLLYDKAISLCQAVEAGGYNCTVSGNKSNYVKAAHGNVKKLNSDNDPFASDGNVSSDGGAVPGFETERGYWINLGTFASNYEAEYYWMFIKQDNGDILNNLQYSSQKADDAGEFGASAVKLRTGPFSIKQRAAQICNIMRYRNIACLVN